MGIQGAGTGGDPVRESYDVIIVGGGPAGAAAGIVAARRGRRVLLVERAVLPFRKVCGEFLSAAGVDLWRQLTGGDLPAGAPVLRRIRFLAPGRATPALAIDPPARGLTRAFLDGALLDAAARSGVEVRAGTSAGAWARAGGGWRVELHGPQGDYEAGAARLVLATGRPLVHGKRRRFWVGRKATCARAGLDADLELYFPADGGYVGVSPVETGRVSICALTRPGGEEWRAHPALRPRGEVEAAGLEVAGAVARFRLGWQAPAGEDAYRVGDALAVWPPLVGDGITVAMASGMRLGEMLSGDGPGAPGPRPEDWHRLWRRNFGAKLRLALGLHALAAARASRPFLFGLVRWFPALGDGLVRWSRSG